MGEENLAPFDEQLESLFPFFDIVAEKIVILDEEGSILYGNQSFIHLMEIDQSETHQIEIQDWFSDWMEIKQKIDHEVQNKIVHLFLLKKQYNQSFRLSFTYHWNTKWLLIFNEPWEPLRSTKNISEIILNHLENPLTFIDQDCRIRVFNQAANLLALRLIKKPIETGESFLEMIKDTEKLNIFLSHIKIGFSGRTSTFLIQFQKVEENDFSYEYKVIPVRDAQEEILGVLISGLDVSKTSLKKNAPEKEFELFLSVFRGVQDPALLWKRTSAGKILLDRYNYFAEMFSEGRIIEWVGKSVEEFFKDQPEIVSRFYDCFETGINKRYETNFELTTIRKQRWVLANYIKITDEYLLNIFVDITEQKETQIQLIENQRQLTTLLENLPCMVYRCKNDEFWTMEFISNEGEELTGYPLVDLLGNKKIAYEELIIPSDRKMVREKIQAAITQGQFFDITYRIQTADQTEKWVWEKGHGILDKNNEIIALEGYIFDITERIKSEKGLQKAVIHTQALKQALEEISSELALSQVLRRILVSLKTVLNFDSATLFLKEQDVFKVVAARGFDNTSRLINRTLPANNKLLRQIQYLKTPIILNDAQDDPRFIRWEGSDHVKGWMGVPLIRRDEFIGLLTINSYKYSAYTQEDANLALSFANSAAVVIENAKLFEKTQQLAMTDTLTGIYNRRYFYELAQKEFVRSKRYQSPLSFILIDIDHFKNVNDHFGHLAGDQILVQFVKRAQEELRQTDIFARFGGEEFIILLPETNLNDAAFVAERLRKITAEFPFLLITAQTFITISLGVTCFRFSSLSVDHLIDECDKAMYEAKQLGRNRVQTWQPK